MDDKHLLILLGKRIAELRKDKEWTQEEFSLKLGIKRSALARIETGNVNSSILVLKKVAEELQISVNELLILQSNI